MLDEPVLEHGLKAAPRSPSWVDTPYYQLELKLLYNFKLTKALEVS
jgi:hypothetical protein